MLKSLRACLVLLKVLGIGGWVLMGEGSEEEIFGYVLLWFGDGFDDVLEAIVGFAQMHVDEGS